MLRLDQRSGEVHPDGKLVEVDVDQFKPQARQLEREQRHQDPFVQSLMLLVTMAAMLVAARFAVPKIVEEVRYAWHRGELRAEYETGTDGLKNVSLDALSDAYQMVTAVVGPTVVHIDVKKQNTLSRSGLSKLSHSMPLSDQGSGVVVDKKGFILTNRHVIVDEDEHGNAIINGSAIRVTLSDGRRVQAEVVGTDLLTDLAVLKVDADEMIPISWGDSDRCRVGTPVWAVGSPFGLDRTVTFGILSGKHRMVRADTRYQDFMQSDVAVNPGNSGGPLVDSRGTLVGINTAIVGDTYRGVSFSIPSNLARQVYERLKTTGRVDRGYLGVMLEEVRDEDVIGDNQRLRGALVTHLPDAGTPAAAAGVQAGDVIVEVDGTRIRDMGHLMRIIGDAMTGTSVNLGIMRDGQLLNLAVTLRTRPLSPPPVQ